MNEQLLHTARGGILYEPSLLSKPELQSPHDQWFEPVFWLKQSRATQTPGGRGSVWFIRDDHRSPPLAWVLRHYQRGGLIAKLVSDRYFWLGAARTRAFREWRLLAYLRSRYLPVPIPVAARYVRTGLSYRADLITQEIAGAHSVAQRLQDTRLPVELWQRIGTTLARFHVLGVRHADLNANNLLLDAADEVHVLDFDRGRIRKPRTYWIKQVMARLLRSLTKLRAQRGIHFVDDDWRHLLNAHDAELARLSKQAGHDW